jgi:hypothetical protein
MAVQVEPTQSEPPTRFPSRICMDPSLAGSCHSAIAACLFVRDRDRDRVEPPGPQPDASRKPGGFAVTVVLTSPPARIPVHLLDTPLL